MSGVRGWLDNVLLEGKIHFCSFRLSLGCHRIELWNQIPPTCKAPVFTESTLAKELEGKGRAFAESLLEHVSASILSAFHSAIIGLLQDYCTSTDTISAHSCHDRHLPVVEGDLEDDDALS